MPSELSESREYLDSVGLSKIEVQRSGIEVQGVSATPTLLIVDDQGVVKGSWVGKLSPDLEKEVIFKSVS